MKYFYFNLAVFFAFIGMILLTCLFTKQDYIAFPKKNSTLFSLLENKNAITPIKKKGQSLLSSETTASFSVLINNKDRILFSQNSKQSLPLASITKLTTAMVAIDNYNLKDKIVIGEQVLKIDGDPKKLLVGDTYTIKDLLYIMLIESNNGAAETIANKMGRISFIEKMNQKAKTLNLTNTKYLNPTGLDIDNQEETNKTSPEDLKKLITNIIEKYPLIPEILSNSDFSVYNEKGIERKIKNTNILLTEDKDFLWGKTGFTDKAKGCLVIISKAPKTSVFEKRYIINIIMGASDRFKEAKKLKEWTATQFSW